MQSTNKGLVIDIFFFQAEDGIRDLTVTGVQTCALPIYRGRAQPCRQAWAMRAQDDRAATAADRKSTRLNSSHSQISYAVFCLKNITWRNSLIPYFSPFRQQLTRRHETDQL